METAINYKYVIFSTLYEDTLGGGEKKYMKTFQKKTSLCQYLVPTSLSDRRYISALPTTRLKYAIKPFSPLSRSTKDQSKFDRLGGKRHQDEIVQLVLYGIQLLLTRRKTGRNRKEPEAMVSPREKIKMRQWVPATIFLLPALFCIALPAQSDSPFPDHKSEHYASNVQYTGGHGTDYTLQQIRWGNHRNFERVVFEFASKHPEGNESLPKMKLETEFYPLRLSLRLPGSNRRRGKIFTSADPFSKSNLLSHVDTFDACGGGQHLSLIPARPVEFNVFTLTSPPRLVVDVILSRMDPMREEKKLSLRTLPLFGDQVCLFLEKAADAGMTPRILADSGGNVFGELGLFDNPDEAFNIRQRLNTSLGRNFALTIRARGMMEMPAVLP